MASAASRTGREAASAKRGAFREQLAHGVRGSGVAYRVLRAPANPPVTFVQDDEGHVCSETTGLDQCMRGAWGRVFAGNGDKHEVAARFLGLFGQDIPLSDEWRLRPITTRNVQDGFRFNAPTSPGADGWWPVELRHLPASAASWLAALLNSIEGGAAWPTQLQEVRCVYLGKTPEYSADSLDYRGLPILSTLYRT
eukprot:6953335-Alexandrium_andersonii.AAC.1